MSLWQRFAGSALGALLAGPLASALSSISSRLLPEDPDADALTTQTLMFSALWSLVGHLAKAEGRVTPAVVARAEALMKAMSLNRTQRRMAIALFEQGKSVEFPRARMARRLRRACGPTSQVPAAVLAQLVQIAQADGAPGPRRRQALAEICIALGLPYAELARLLGETPASRNRQVRPAASEACAILGVKPSASMDEITRAYRRLINRHHPDKLHGSANHPEAIRAAEEQTRAIRAAFETLRARHATQT